MTGRDGGMARRWKDPTNHANDRRWRSISAKRYVTLKVRLPGLTKKEVNTPEKKEKLTKSIAKILGLSPSLIEIVFEEVDVRRLWSERARMMEGGKQ